MDKLGKICRHLLKERLKISKIAQFGSDLLKPNEGLVPLSRKILHKLALSGELDPLSFHKLCAICT